MATSPRPARSPSARGAKVAHVDDIDQALHALRDGQGADLIMIDVELDIQRLIDA